jgi:hypothetical protein
MGCEILDTAKEELRDRKLRCREECKLIRRCPFINSQLARVIFPAQPVPQITNTPDHVRLNIEEAVD